MADTGCYRLNKSVFFINDSLASDLEAVPTRHNVRQGFIHVARQAASFTRELLKSSGVLLSEDSRSDRHPVGGERWGCPIGIGRRTIVDSRGKLCEELVEIVVDCSRSFSGEGEESFVVFNEVVIVGVFGGDGVVGGRQSEASTLS